MIAAATALPDDEAAKAVRLVSWLLGALFGVLIVGVPLALWLGPQSPAESPPSTLRVAALILGTIGGFSIFGAFWVAADTLCRAERRQAIFWTFVQFLYLPFTAPLLYQRLWGVRAPRLGL